MEFFHGPVSFRRIRGVCSAIRETRGNISRNISAAQSRPLFIISGRERGTSENFVPFLLLVEWVNELR